MFEEWCDVSLGDVITLQRGFDITKAEQRAGLVPVVSSSGIGSYHDTAMLSGPGVVIGRKGTLGTTFFLSGDYWPHDTTLWVKDFKGNDPKFVYYLLQSLKEELLWLDHGTANPTLNRNHAHLLRVLLPKLPEQERIGSLLWAMDEKIEINNQMNVVLERTASAIFKSWFVDFEPVLANASGHRLIGLDTKTAALFPADFEDSPIGRIPKGWKTDGLDSIATFLNGLALQKYPTSKTEANWFPVIKIAQLRANSTYGAERANTSIPTEYLVTDGDVLFSWSGSLLARIWTGGQGALNQHLFKVTSEHYPRWFYYFWVLEHLEDFQDIAEGKATTMGHIRRHHLSEALVAVPPPSLIEQVSEHIEVHLRLKVSRDIENRLLVELRNLLLPKLLSGEIRLKDAEKAVEAVV